VGFAIEPKRVKKSRMVRDICRYPQYFDAWGNASWKWGMIFQAADALCWQD
jgi:hypothetical protein